MKSLFLILTFLILTLLSCRDNNEELIIIEKEVLEIKDEVLDIEVKEAIIKEILLIDNKIYTNKYDKLFIKYSKQYFGVWFDWRWFKSQGVTESSLNPKAISPVGAKGIMQIMPGTWGDILKENKWFNYIDIEDPKWNIPSGIYYNRKLYNMWIAERSEEDRLKFMFASYNAGMGTILKAQKKCDNITNDCNKWIFVRNYSPVETQNYVDKIFKLMSHI